MAREAAPELVLDESKQIHGHFQAGLQQHFDDSGALMSSELALGTKRERGENSCSESLERLRAGPPEGHTFQVSSPYSHLSSDAVSATRSILASLLLDQADDHRHQYGRVIRQSQSR